jgi:hypothetical protein
MAHGACPYLAQWLTEPVPGPMPQRPNRACPHVRHRPNGAAHTSPGCNPGVGSLKNRMRSEGTPHHGRANGWSRVMRRSFRTRRSLVCHTRGCTPGWYAVPRWGTSNRLSKPLRACPHLQFNVHRACPYLLHGACPRGPHGACPRGPRYLAQWLTVSRPVSHGACPYLAQWLTEPVPGPMPQRPNRACPHVRHRPNGAAHTSPGCNPGVGSLMNRMRSEGTPHHGHVDG